MGSLEGGCIEDINSNSITLSCTMLVHVFMVYQCN